MKPAPEPLPTPSAPLIGAHMSIAGGVGKSIDRALSVGCSAMQIFVKNNMQWFAKAPLSEEELAGFRGHPRRGGVLAFGHSGYLINLAAANPEFAETSRRALREELLRADQLGLPFLVLHPGAHMGAGEEAGLRKIVAGLDEVFAAVAEARPGFTAKIALENTAGQGTSLGCKLEHLAWIIAHSREPQRLCVCIDTAHLFAAGYDISTEEGTLATFREFDRLMEPLSAKLEAKRGEKKTANSGAKQGAKAGETAPGLLAAIHCNDSKTALGSRVDRHEHPGQGRIGPAPFRVLMRHPRFAGIPKVLETPKGKELREDAENLARLRAWAAETR